MKKQVQELDAQIEKYKKQAQDEGSLKKQLQELTENLALETKTLEQLKEQQ